MWTLVRFASPTPYVVTASKSPACWTFMMFGSANARATGAVGPVASCASAGENRTCRIARPGTGIGSPLASETSWAT